MCVRLSDGINIEEPDGFCKRTAIGWAAYQGHAAAVELLIRKKANVNVLDKRHDTPLGLAAYRGHWPVCKLLLEAGADERVKCDGDLTAAAWAARQRFRHVSQLIDSWPRTSKQDIAGAEEDSKRAALERARGLRD